MQLYSILLCFVRLKLLTRLNVFLQTSYKYVFCIVCVIATYLVGSWVVVLGFFFFPTHLCMLII